MLLGVDRLDYTKGIDQRIRAVAELFGEGVLTTPRHVMVQIAVPSREDDTHYQHERENLERLVGEVNGAHSRVGHPAIHYLHQSVRARRADRALPRGRRDARDAACATA